MPEKDLNQTLRSKYYLVLEGTCSKICASQAPTLKTVNQNLSEFPMLWGGQREMPGSNSELDPLPQTRSLRENQRFSLVAYPSISTLHSGLETAASLAPPWHCKISARANTGKHPEMATNQNHNGPSARLTNLSFSPG